MKKIKISIIVLMFAVLACVLLYAGKRWYSHESEVNAKLWEIQTATGTIADSLSEKEPPYIDQLGKACLQEILDRFDGSEDNVYLKLAAGKPVRILIVGDSITAQDWTAEIANQISYHFGSECQLKNISMGGNTSYAGYVRAKLSRDEQYDLALVCFGQNDSEEDFGMFYESLVREILKSHPYIEMISVLESSQRIYTEKINSIMEIANYYGIATADTIAAYNNSGFSYEALSPDGVHPGELGKELYLRTVMNVIFERVKESVFQKIDKPEENNKETEEDVSQGSDFIKPALYPEAAMLEECVFISAENCTRTNELGYSVSVSAYKGLLGIYCARVPGKNDIQVFCENELICSYSEDFNHSFTQEMILLFDKEQHELAGNIEIVFNTIEQAESFQGIAISIV